MASKKEEKVTSVDSKSDNSTAKLIGLIVILMVIVVVAVLSLNGTIIINKEGRLNSAMTHAGSKFYTEFFYDKLSEGKESKDVKKMLEQYKSVGIKVNLSSIKKYSYDNSKRNIDLLEKYNCDASESKVTIYPSKPYGKKNFTIKADIKCNK